MSYEHSIRPGINDHFRDNGTDGSAFLQRFETEAREIYNKCTETITAIGVQRDMHVADIGAGTGLFLSPLARAVGPKGRVYAIEPFDKFVAHITTRIATLPAAEREVIRIVQNREVDVGPSDDEGGVPDNSLDLAIAIDTYHHFEYPSLILPAVRAKMKDSGRFVVLDFEKIEGVSSEWVMGHVRANRETVLSEIEREGFELVENLKEKVGLKENYLLVFRKREGYSPSQEQIDAAAALRQKLAESEAKRAAWRQQRVDAGTSSAAVCHDGSNTVTSTDKTAAPQGTSTTAASASSATK